MTVQKGDRTAQNRVLLSRIVEEAQKQGVTQVGKEFSFSVKRTAQSCGCGYRYQDAMDTYRDEGILECIKAPQKPSAGGIGQPGVYKFKQWPKEAMLVNADSEPARRPTSAKAAVALDQDPSDLSPTNRLHAALTLFYREKHLNPKQPTNVRLHKILKDAQVEDDWDTLIADFERLGITHTVGGKPLKNCVFMLKVFAQPALVESYKAWRDHSEDAEPVAEASTESLEAPVVVVEEQAGEVAEEINPRMAEQLLESKMPEGELLDGASRRMAEQLLESRMPEEINPRMAEQLLESKMPEEPLDRPEEPPVEKGAIADRMLLEYTSMLRTAASRVDSYPLLEQECAQKTATIEAMRAGREPEVARLREKLQNLQKELDAAKESAEFYENEAIEVDNRLQRTRATYNSVLRPFLERLPFTKQPDEYAWGEVFRGCFTMAGYSREDIIKVEEAIATVGARLGETPANGE